jgi:WD40 repeat protein
VKKYVILLGVGAAIDHRDYKSIDTFRLAKTIDSVTMQLDRAIKFTNRLLLNSRQRELSELELVAFDGVWLEISYQQSSQNSNYEMVTIKNTASRLLQDLSEAVGERVSKKNCRSVLMRLAMTNEERVDLADAPTDIQPFCGRDLELDKLMTWLTIDRCKLVGILGIGGIGKTALAARLSDLLAEMLRDRDLTDDFDLVIWRSLREAPPLPQLLGELVQFLSEFTEIEVPSSNDRAISRLLYYLKQKRCLLVFDNLEAIMEAGDYAGKYRSTYTDYGQLFQKIGTTRHQSCLLFTSREPPPELAELAGIDLPVRSLYLAGLEAAAPTLLAQIGLQGNESQLLAVSERCQGNPLYLRIVANTIVHSFNSQIDNFLAANQYTYGKIAYVLQAQLDRLSRAEKLIIYYLAIARESISIASLEIHLQPLGYGGNIVQTIDSLQQRSLIEVTQGQRYTLQNVVMEFMTGATLRELAAEIGGDGEQFFFNSLALYPASSPTYIREIQQRLLLAPLLVQLTLQTDRSPLDRRLRLLLRDRQAGLTPSYAVGNIINLLLALGADLRDYNLTNSYIAEVDFQTVNLQQVNFSNSRFDRCRFAQTLGTIIDLAFSPDGKYLAASDTNYQIAIWDVASDRQIALLLGHQSWVWNPQFSHDNKYLLSGSSDRTMRIWEVASGKCLQVITAHQDLVWKVAFSLNSNLAISIGADRYIKIWWWRTGRNLLAFKVPDVQVRDGAFHGRRGLLAVCGGEGIKIWQVWTGRRIQQIQTVAASNLKLISFSPDGNILVAANFACEIHCWEVDSGRYLHQLCGHPTQVFEVNYDDAGRLISTCLEQMRVWNLTTGSCHKTINLARDCGKGVAYHTPTIATGSDNGTIKIWNLETGKCLQTSTGNAPRVMAVAAHARDRLLVSTQDNGTLKLWDFSGSLLPGQLPPLRTYRGHQGLAMAIAISDDGRSIASTGSDRIINIWDVKTGEIRQSFTGHIDYATQLLFVDDRTLLSCSYDKTVRQWDLTTGTHEVLTYLERQWCMILARSPDRRSIAFGSDLPMLTILDRPTGQIDRYSAVGNRLRTLAYTQDRRFIVAISDDRHLNLWEIEDNYRHRYWQVGDREVTAILPHPLQTHLLIIATEDGELAIWDLDRQTCLSRFPAHDREIRSLTLLANPDRAISCGVDGSIKVWEFTDDTLTEIYKIELEKPYRDLQLTGVTGLNQAQLTTLDRLGAII